MRFALAHKTTTYLMVLCAYLALLTSGELPLLAIFVPIFAVSWFWEPPRIRFERWAAMWTAGAVLAFVACAVLFLAGQDILLLGAQYLVVLTAIKLFSRREPKDYLQIYVLSFLMLTSGTVLNSSLSYGLFFLCYVIAATWGLILFHLRRELEETYLLRHAAQAGSQSERVARILNSRRIVGARFFAGTSLVSVSMFVAASLLFLMIPRIGFGLFMSKNRSDVHLAGFSDGVQLGGHGLIKSDSTIVMRVHVDSRYEGRRAPYIHWRGVAFDHYSKGQWTRSKKAPLTQRAVEPEGRATIHHVLYDRGAQSSRVLRAARERAMRQEIYLEPTGYDVVFGASMPIAFEFETRYRERTSRDRNDELRHPHDSGIKYVAYSDPNPPPAAELRAAAGPLPADYGVYLQIPDEVPARVLDLAREITADEPTAYDKAVALESWLRDELDYTLQMESPGRMEPIDYFLFERRRGHCEYFSSAMAIMARAAGLPARNVNGFLGGEWNEYDDYIAVRAGDAHSWVEIYFPGSGWVTFDPTPAADLDQLGRGGAGLMARFGRLLDTLRFKWFKWVIEYDIYRQMKMFRKLGNMFRGGARGIFEGQGGAARAWLRHNRVWIVGAVSGAVIAVIGLVLWKRRRESGGVSSRRRRGAIAVVYLRAQRRFARRGFRRGEGQTPREHARVLAERGVPGAAPMAELVELYYRAQYAGATTALELARARDLESDIDRAART